jgi:hypothetical protein
MVVKNRRSCKHRKQRECVTVSQIIRPFDDKRIVIISNGHDHDHDMAKMYGSNCKTCVPRRMLNSGFRGSSCNMAVKNCRCPKGFKMPQDFKADVRGTLVWRENSIDRRERREDNAGYGFSI